MPRGIEMANRTTHGLKDFTLDIYIDNIQKLLKDTV